jgi:hypothetical protein
MTRVAQRDVVQALKLTDGTFLIRSGCCRPGKCAPAVGARCCLSARCACDWPRMYFGPAEIAPARWPATRVALVSAATAAGLTIGAGIVWAVATAVAWLLAHLLLVGVIVAVVVGVSTRACTTIIKITHHH